MADQSKRGGMKQGHEADAEGKQKQGVRPVSTADAKERHQPEPREARPADEDFELSADEVERRSREAGHAQSGHPQHGQEMPPDDASHHPL